VKKVRFEHFASAGSTVTSVTAGSQSLSIATARDDLRRSAEARAALAVATQQLPPGTYALPVRATTGANERSKDTLIKFWILNPRPY
jgi:hypothetical protein